MARGRIYYVLGDYAPPSGGVRRMYRHVHLLNRLGFDAKLLHQQKPFVTTWHGYRVPTGWVSDGFTLRAEDAVVVTENSPALLRGLRAARCRRVVCALAWAPHLLKLEPGETWAGLGVNEVITPSPVVADYLRWRFGLEATVIGNTVDAALYVHRREEKSDSIAYMPRKNPAGPILRSAYARRPPFERWRWAECRDLEHAEYARVLRAARIYLPPSAMEGLNHSVLEAMACGCLVVGYHGGGGRAFMRGSGPEQNCVLVENGDLPAYGPILEGVLRELERDPRAYDAVIANAVATARPFQDESAELRSLESFYARLVDAPVAAGDAGKSFHVGPAAA
jgi:hypothetical protein